MWSTYMYMIKFQKNTPYLPVSFEKTADAKVNTTAFGCHWKKNKLSDSKKILCVSWCFVYLKLNIHFVTNARISEQYIWFQFPWSFINRFLADKHDSLVYGQNWRVNFKPSRNWFLLSTIHLHYFRKSDVTIVSYVGHICHLIYLTNVWSMTIHVKFIIP